MKFLFGTNKLPTSVLTPSTPRSTAMSTSSSALSDVLVLAEGPTLAPKPTPVESEKSVFDESAPISTSVEEIIPSYRSVITSLCAKREDQCVALDLGYNTVGLISVDGFARTHAYQAIVEALKPRALSLALEKSVSTEMFSKIREHLAEQANQVLSMELADDRRNISLYDDLIQGAYLLGATDVHFFYRSDEEPAQVRLRLFGRMVEWKKFDGKFIRQALAAAYSAMAVSGTNSENDWSPSKPCSVITAHRLRDCSGRLRSVSGRFTSRQAVGGACKATVRLLDTDVRDVRIPSFEQLGYGRSQVQEQLLPALRKNQGLILIAGGTGSGKSTALRTAMDVLPNKDSLERYSVEDPVEYILPGVIQLSIQRASDASEASTRLSFGSALRDLMRMDPDVAMIGEIRDAETAQLACELVNTGHRVLSTVHGNGAIDVFDRLTGKTLDVAPVTLASGSFLLASIYQKLLPILCSHCKLPAKERMTDTQTKGLQRFGIDPGCMYVANPHGCPECRLPGIEPTGTKGLTVVAEVITPDSELLDHIRAQNWNAARLYWRNQRRTDFTDGDMQGKTAFEHALYKMASGIVDINDIERDFEPLISYDIHFLEDMALTGVIR